MVYPEIKKNKVTNDQLVKTIIECRTKLNESNLAKKQKFKGKKLTKQF